MLIDFMHETRGKSVVVVKQSMRRPWLFACAFNYLIYPEEIRRFPRTSVAGDARLPRRQPSGSNDRALEKTRYEFN
jgi:hypothetical protein